MDVIEWDEFIAAITDDPQPPVVVAAGSGVPAEPVEGRPPTTYRTLVVAVGGRRFRLIAPDPFMTVEVVD